MGEHGFDLFTLFVYFIQLLPLKIFLPLLPRHIRQTAHPREQDFRRLRCWCLPSVCRCARRLTDRPRKRFSRLRRSTSGRRVRRRGQMCRGTKTSFWRRRSCSRRRCERRLQCSAGTILQNFFGCYSDSADAIYSKIWCVLGCDFYNRKSNQLGIGCGTIGGPFWHHLLWF